MVDVADGSNINMRFLSLEFASGSTDSKGAAAGSDGCSGGSGGGEEGGNEGRRKKGFRG